MKAFSAKRFFGALLGLIVSLGTVGALIIALVVTFQAQQKNPAHQPLVSGSSICQADGQYLVTWTVGNSQTEVGQDMTVSTIDRTVSGIVVGTNVSPAGSVQGTELVPGTTSGTITLHVGGHWNYDGFNAAGEGSVNLGGTCVLTTPTSTPTPTHFKITPDPTPRPTKPNQTATSSTPTATEAPSATATNTDVPDTSTPIVTPTPTHTQVSTSTETHTPVASATSSNTPTPSVTPQVVPSLTSTATNTGQASQTATSSPTLGPSATATASHTAGPSVTPTNTPQGSPTATATPKVEPWQTGIGVAAFCDINNNKVLDWGDAPLEHGFVKVGLTGNNVATYWIGETNPEGLSGLYSGQVTSVTPLSATAPNNLTFLSYWELPNDKNVIPFQPTWPRLVNPNGDLVRVAALFDCQPGPTNTPETADAPKPSGGLPLGFLAGIFLLLLLPAIVLFLATRKPKVGDQQ